MGETRVVTVQRLACRRRCWLGLKECGCSELRERVTAVRLVGGGVVVMEGVVVRGSVAAVVLYEGAGGVQASGSVCASGARQVSAVQ